MDLIHQTCPCSSLLCIVNFMEAFSDSSSDSIPFNFDLTSSFSFLIDCKTVGLFLKISKEIGKAWRKSLTRAKRASLLEYAKIRTVLQSTFLVFSLT